MGIISITGNVWKCTIRVKVDKYKDFPDGSKLDFRSWELESLGLIYANTSEWIIKQMAWVFLEKKILTIS